MSDWANIPTDILVLVVHLVEMEDFFALGVVCKSWKSVTSTFRIMPSLPTRYPLVLMPEDHQPWIKPRRRFYSLSAKKMYGFDLLEVARRKCLGMFDGWLLIADRELNVNLFHPFSRQQVALPRLVALRDQSEFGYPYLKMMLRLRVVKLAMSRNPLDEDAKEDFVVVAISLSRDLPLLALARKGDQVWTSIARPPNMVYDDVVFYKGVFYAVYCIGVLFAVDISNNEIAPKEITAQIESPRWLDQKYLVTSSGDLLLVCRLSQGRRGPCSDLNLVPQKSSLCSTVGFVVYKLEDAGGIDGHPYQWTKVENLEGRALFLGGNASVSMCSSKRVKAGCIYFSEDVPESYPYGRTLGGCNTWVYNMESQSIEPHYYPS